jgi:hypothetical protein
MQDRPVRPRDLVIDNRDRHGIVISRHPRQPGRKWLDDQFDARMRDPTHRIWWNVMPLDGGLVVVPEGLMRVMREATFADALQAVAGGNEAAVKTLIGLFPDLAEYARSLRQ